MTLPPARPHSSGSWRAVQPERVPLYVGELLDWRDKTEDWKTRHSQRISSIESDVTSLKTELHARALLRGEDRLHLDQRFAEMRLLIETLRAQMRQMMSIAIVLWVVLTTIAGLAARFL